MTLTALSPHRRALLTSFSALAFLLCAPSWVSASAQKTIAGPPTDSSAQASPVQPTPNVKAVDASFEASPEVGPSEHHGAHVPVGTAIAVTLSRAIDSGRLKNGDTVAAKLAAPVKTSSGATLAAGTPVSVSVIATVPAGKLTAVGEFSLQALKVGSIDVFTDIKTYRGEAGHRDVADAAPAVGTDAGLPAGTKLTFKVQKQPTAADAPPANVSRQPGSVDGTASGGPPPANAKTNSGEPVFGAGNPTPQSH
jgi:hypothetical protein